MDAQQQVLSPSIELEDRACAYCGCAAADRLFIAEDRLHGGPGQFAVVRCQGCGLMRTNPRPTLEAMKAYYPDHYGPYLSTASDSTGRARGYARKTDTAIPNIGPGQLL